MSQLYVCEYCPKTYKTIKGFNNHREKMHQNALTQFHYFDKLPLDMHYEIFKYLNYKDLLSVFRAYVTPIFWHNKNNLWENDLNKFAQGLPRQFNFVSYGITCIKYYNSLCFYCMDKTYSLNDFYKLPICKKCQEQHLPMITKTMAKTYYLLTDKQLIKLPFITKRNGYGGLTSLFLKKDIELLAPIDLEDKLKIKEERSTIRKQKKDERLNKRRQELTNELKKYGLHIREDSKLCQGYIDGSLDKGWTLNKVVSMCREMNWLYTKTNYKKLLDKALKKAQYEDDEYYNFNETYYEVEPTIREEVKKRYNFSLDSI